MDPVERARSASRRLTEPVDSVAQAVARRATELVVDSLDVNALLGQIDVNKLLGRVDVDRLLDQVNVNRLLDQVDVNRVLDRLDVERVMSRVDVDAVASRVDVNAIADRIDISALLDKTELSALLARSSSTVFSEGIDLVRSQAVGLDNFIARWVDRALGRGTRRPAAPRGPRLLVSGQAGRLTPGLRELTGLRGHYAGSVSRFLACAIDLGVVSGLFGLALAAVSFAIGLVSGHAFSWDGRNLLLAIAYACWWFAYFAYGWAASGKTFGMAVLGIQVVSREGMMAGPRRAIVRTLAFPLSFLLLGLGFAGVLVGGERRALHDVIAGTAVVYTWDARAQRLHFLAASTPASGDPAQVSAQPGARARERPVTQRQAAPRQEPHAGPTATCDR